MDEDAGAGAGSGLEEGAEATTASPGSAGAAALASGGWAKVLALDGACSAFFIIVAGRASEGFRDSFSKAFVAAGAGAFAAGDAGTGREADSRRETEPAIGATEGGDSDSKPPLFKTYTVMMLMPKMVSTAICMGMKRQGRANPSQRAFQREGVSMRERTPARKFAGAWTGSKAAISRK